MGTSHNRDIYFERNIRPAKDHIAYLDALAKSPHKLHNRMAVALRPMADEMEKVAEKQVASEAFAKSLQI